jgi:ABC-type transporter Mla subunit MlaD
MEANARPGDAVDDQGSVAVLAKLDELARVLGSVRSTVDALPGGVEAAVTAVASEIGEQHEAVSEALDRFRDTMEVEGGNVHRVHEAVKSLSVTVDGGLERMRSSVGEGLVGVGRRSSAVMKQLERVAAMLEDDRRGLESLQALAQTLAAATEQSGAMSGRVADLVLESRSAMRGDIERLESSVHLENVKQQQQAQAHLAQAVATIGDVVERESVVLSQRVSAVTAAVETIRTVLHAHVEDATRPVRERTA